MFPSRDCVTYHKNRSNAIIKNETQPSMDSLRGKSCLSVCQKSNTISKKSGSHVTVSQQIAECDAYVQKCQNGYVQSGIETYTPDIECDEAIDQREFLNEENSQFQKHSSTFADSGIVGRMESTLNCTSNLETIFSPALEPVEIHSVPNIDDDAVGSDKDLNVPGSGADDSDDNRSSCDYQTCNISDFFISDMIITGLPFDGSTVDDDITEINPFPDYKCAEPKTLVHSTLEHCDDADFTFTVFFNMNEHTVYVKQRPFLHTFLERVAEMFEVVIFTASQSIYAAQLLDILDPDKKLISRRVYRESCIFTDGSYTKDLTVLGVDLAKVAIIDNSPQVFTLSIFALTVLLFTSLFFPQLSLLFLRLLFESNAFILGYASA
ncbi:hypothetical protein GH714_028241 [Hevea brasiliensis]|uniref:FCP1 homology domain-containing protein n=1 Tax=Hevea brasiliensis TaxID=3981 RepID=A0A6A6MLQ8_HEVBR|nr:hypothetical protein GH714_028241 [Hevea brasiliensis]